MMIHVRFEGRSFDISGGEFAHAVRFDNKKFLGELARYLDVAPSRLARYVVDRRPDGSVIVHPEAVYG